MNQAKANSIQPAGSAQYILVDHRVGKEVDQSVRRKSESMEFDLVAIGVKHAVRSPEKLADSAGQVEIESLGDLGSEYAE